MSMHRKTMLLVTICLVVAMICASGEADDYRNRDLTSLLRWLENRTPLTGALANDFDADDNSVIDLRDAYIMLYKIAGYRISEDEMCVSVNSKNIEYGEEIVWTLPQPNDMLYMFFVIGNGEIVATSKGLTKSNTCRYTPKCGGVYSLQIYALSDNHMNTYATDKDATVTLEPLSIDNFTYRYSSSLDIIITGYVGKTDSDIIIPPYIELDGHRHTVRGIAQRAFYERSDLTGRLLIPDTVTTIGAEAFAGCCNLVGELYLPDSITSIDSYAFRYCNGFNGELHVPENLIKIEYGTFSYCGGFTGKLVLPKKLRAIGQYAFRDCANLFGDLVFSDELSRIEYGAFYRCENIGVKAYVPKSVVILEEMLFSGTGVDTIIGSVGSSAETYAKNNGYTFQSVED